MREVRVSEDVRRVTVGHSLGDTHDKNYGEALRKSPNILHQEFCKADLSWAP
jgi:hypothetical protein